AKAATSTIPIVFTICADPVKVGLVDSLNRPGGNATGVSLLTSSAETKRLGLLSDAVAHGVFGVLINPNSEVGLARSRAGEVAARVVVRPIQIVNAATDQELEEALAPFARGRVAALLVTADPLLTIKRDRIVALAAQFKLPAIYPYREYAETGGLMSYGISPQKGNHQNRGLNRPMVQSDKPAHLPVLPY